MLCCVGLIAGAAVGQSLGGPWTFIAPAAGFGIGLVADMKFMHKMHASPRPPQPKNQVDGAKDDPPIISAEAPQLPQQTPHAGGG